MGLIVECPFETAFVDCDTAAQFVEITVVPAATLKAVSDDQVRFDLPDCIKPQRIRMADDVRPIGHETVSRFVDQPALFDLAVKFRWIGSQVKTP